jgi:hypothetical protein
VAELCAFRLGRDIALLRVNDPAERPNCRAPRNKIQSSISLSLYEGSGSVHVAPTFRWALYNRADAHLKVGAT